MKWLIRIGFIVSLFPLMAITCTKKEGPNCHQRLYLTNNTGSEIIGVKCYRNFNDNSSSLDHQLSEANYKDIKNQTWRYSFHILPFKTELIIDMTGSDNRLEATLSFCDILIYILDAKTVDEHTPEELVDGRAVLDKRLYTLADIDRIGDTIVFD